MEKKKLLLVAISVGVFLVIVIGASLLVFAPGNAVPPASAAGTVGPAAAGPRQPIAPGSPGTIPADPEENQPASVDPTGMIRNTEDFRVLQTPPASTVTIQGNNGGTDDADLRQFGVQQNTETGGNRVVITVPRPSTAAVSDTPKRSSSPAPAAKPPARSPAPAQAKQPAAAPARKPAAAPQPRAYDAYWVQTGSFSARNRADTVKETLASKGITSIIENRDVDGKTWYRVRVGPYISQNEADYWLSRIKLIDGFEASQVWKSQVRR
ncbi:MAG: SPOR domain-containing protein [Spirochaetaceae bacterium]|jgi:DedD protein|nr:SPOR domain-containing protein [Spirochaetaceae bacterium]